jgi:hypothetical protein
MAKFTSGDQFRRWFEAKLDEITDASRRAVEQAADRGANLTRQYISTRGTPKSGKAGRIDTGRMLNAVESRVTKSNDEEVESRFGWLDDREAYFLLQEGGTSTIPAMYALSDAGEEVIRDVERDIDRIVRRA